MTEPRFLTWRDLPESKVPIIGYLRAPFRFYFGNKTPELVMQFEPFVSIREVIDDDNRLVIPSTRPFAVGMEGYIRLERLFGQNLLAWPDHVVQLRRGFRGGHNYVEVVPELPR